MTDLQPIETAPEGERILINPHGEWLVAKWYPGKYQGTGQPTNWAPLPALREIPEQGIS